MNIELSKEQYLNLLKLVYLGNRMINAIRLEKYVVFDKETKEFYPTHELEFGTDIENYRQEYNEDNFWERAYL